jgi:hypothetical protein
MITFEKVRKDDTEKINAERSLNYKHSLQTMGRENGEKVGK